MPFDPAIITEQAAILPDSCFYIDALKGLVPPAIAAYVQTPGRSVLHCEVCRAELAAGSAKLPPDDPRTPGSRTRIAAMLARMLSKYVVGPSQAAWDEAGALAGTLARTQGLAKGAHLTLILDAAILLTAIESNATVITANVRDFDLLLQLCGDAKVLFYRPVSPHLRGAPVAIG